MFKLEKRHSGNTLILYKIMAESQSRIIICLGKRCGFPVNIPKRFLRISKKKIDPPRQHTFVKTMPQTDLEFCVGIIFGDFPPGEIRPRNQIIILIDRKGRNRSQIVGHTVSRYISLRKKFSLLSIRRRNFHQKP